MLQIDRNFSDCGLNVDASGRCDLHRTSERSGKHGSRREIMGQHMDNFGALDHHRTALIKGKRGPPSWDHASSCARNCGRPSKLLKIERSAFLGQNLLYKPMFFSCFLNS